MKAEFRFLIFNLAKLK